MESTGSSARWLAILRIMLGVIFLTTWFANLEKGFYTPAGLEDFFTRTYPQSHNPITFYANFITGVLLPARAVFAPFQLVGELTLGVLLLLGVFTPVAGILGAFFLANIFLATFGAEWPWTYISLIVVSLCVAFTHAGRTFGIDAALARRLPSSPLV